MKRAAYRTAPGDSLGEQLRHRYGRFKYRRLLPVYRALAGAIPALRPADTVPVRASGVPASPVPAGAPSTAAAPRGHLVHLSGAEFGPPPFQRSQQLLRELARAGYAAWTVRPGFQRGNELGLWALEDGIHAVGLPGPPYPDLARGEPSARTTARALDSLASLREAAGIEHATIKVDLPFWTPLALAARARFGWPVIYDCMDDVGEFDASGPSTRRREASLISEADLVVTTAAALQARIGGRARRTLLLPNAADFSHFRATDSPPRAEAPLTAGEPPTVGYMGMISEWFDHDAVTRAAEARPDWRFVLVGEVTTPAGTALGHLPNVSLPGPCPYPELPTLVRTFDVGLIPFRDTPLTRAVDPVKFYEYAASGIPIVATPLPDLLPHGDLFHPIGPDRDLVGPIESALAEDPALRSRRIEFAASNTWRHRCDTLIAALSELG